MAANRLVREGAYGILFSSGFDCSRMHLFAEKAEIIASIALESCWCRLYAHSVAFKANSTFLHDAMALYSNTHPIDVCNSNASQVLGKRMATASKLYVRLAQLSWAREKLFQESSHSTVKTIFVCKTTLFAQNWMNFILQCEKRPIPHHTNDGWKSRRGKKNIQKKWIATANQNRTNKWQRR